MREWWWWNRWRRELENMDASPRVVFLGTFLNVLEWECSEISKSGCQRRSALRA